MGLGRQGDTGESYRKMLLHMAKESEIDSPANDDLARMDRKRVGKALSNDVPKGLDGGPFAYKMV